MSRLIITLVLMCAVSGCAPNLKLQLDAINQQCNVEVNGDPALVSLQGHVPLAGFPTAAMYADEGVVTPQQAEAVSAWDAHSRHCDDLKAQLADKSASYMTTLLAQHDQDKVILKSLLMSRKVTFGSFNIQAMAEHNSFNEAAHEISQQRQQQKLAAMAAFGQAMQQVSEQQQQAIRANRPIDTNCMSNAIGSSVSTSCTSN